MKTVLSIAGTDPSGGAGVQADLKTISAHGVFAMNIITSVVAQNTSRVISILDMPDNMINDQIDGIFEDIQVDGVKIGMLNNSRIMTAVANKLKEYKPKNIVLDPVMYAKNGCPLMDEDSITTLIEEVIPLADLITPNIPEAEKIADMKINNLEDMKTASKKIVEQGAKAVLLKGGHSQGDAIDVLYDGENFFEYKTERIDTKNTHGTGCTLSASIASNLALGKPMDEAIKESKEYITNAIKYSLDLGKGHGPTNHFYKFFSN